MTVQEILEVFLTEQQLRGNSANTVTFYRSCVGRFLSFSGPLELEELRPPLLKQYLLSLQARPLSSVTVQTYIRALRVFVRWLYEEGLLPADLSAKLRLPKAKRKVIDILTDEEARRLMASFDPHISLQLRNYCICALMLDSGLRMGEVVTLQLPLLHLAEGYAIVEGKGNKQRVVPLGLHTRKALMRYLSRRPGAVQTPRVFLTTDLTPITDSTIKQMMRKLKGRVGIPRLRPHLLRHTFATRYLENGGDIYLLQQILGHTTLEMVRRYVHFSRADSVSKSGMVSPLDKIL